MEKHTYDTESEAFSHASHHLLQLINQPDQCLLLLSGGSAAALYVGLSQHIRENKPTNIRIGLIDERYGPVDHRDSNALLIESTSQLWSTCEQAGVEYCPILTGESLEDEAAAYQQWLKKSLAICPIRIGVLGIGQDGHTAGIMPGLKDEFEGRFNGDDLVIGYSSNTRFDHRITVTNTALKQLTSTLVMAGANKKEVLHELEQVQLGQLHQLPAVILHQLSDVQVFTTK